MRLRLLIVPTVVLVLCSGAAYAQDRSIKSILVDIGHGQRFWNDPARMQGRPQNEVDRARYLTGQLERTAAVLGAKLEYVGEELAPKRLAKGHVLFIHVPTRPYLKTEAEAIRSFVRKGGALFIVMEEDYWSKMEDTNVNEIIGDFGLKYDGPIPGEQSGGRTKAGLITKEALKIPYHGGRAVSGGVPFCFTQEDSQQPFGVFVQLKKGTGRVIAMGDGMASLYMNSWKGVTDYRCQDFMREAFRWLLRQDGETGAR